ncbi:hypothetical protein ACFLRW_05605 [Acidobacteriota bacterium]
MKKQILVILLASFCLVFSAHQIQEQSIVINVEIPTRVFDGNTFVDNLTIDDFEIYEDGQPQKLDAIYLIKKKSIERREEIKRFNPQTSRQFFLWFQISEYMPRIREAIEYFFENVFIPGDNLVVITSVKVYNLNSQAIELKSKEEISDQLVKIIRKDALSGNVEYRAAMRDLHEIVQIIEERAEESTNTSTVGDEITSDFSVFNVGSLEEVLQSYSTIVENLEDLRKMDQNNLLEYAEYLKEKDGQKHIFLFYEREFLPQLAPNTLDKFMSQYQDNPAMQLTMSSLFQTYKRDVTIDVDRVKQTFADSSLSVHFLFLKSMRAHRRGLQMQERSEDVYNAFRQMAQATGGITESSSNPAWAFQKAVDAFENYYLLYYSPQNYRADGKFKNIVVKIKNRKFRVTHRTGYFAN